MNRLTKMFLITAPLLIIVTSGHAQVICVSPTPISTPAMFSDAGCTQSVPVYPIQEDGNGITFQVANTSGNQWAAAPSSYTSPIASNAPLYYKKPIGKNYPCYPISDYTPPVPMYTVSYHGALLNTPCCVGSSCPPPPPSGN